MFAIGTDIFIWIKLLVENKFNISWKKIPNVFVITFIIILFTPLAIFEKIFAWKKLQEVELKHEPIFILGHWRQGTTFLHELFRTSPENEVMYLYESIFPNHFLYSSDFLSWLMGIFLPETRPQDSLRITSELASEHDFAIANLSAMSPYTGAYFPGNQDEYTKYVTLEGLSDKKIEKLKSVFVYMMKKLTLKKKFRQLVLKSPADTARIKLLMDMYPNAKYIHIARNPYEVFYSTKRMHQKLIPIFQLQDGYPDLDNFVLKVYKDMYTKFYDEVDLIPKENFIEIKYEDLIADPLKIMGKLYVHLSIPRFEQAKPHMVEYIERNKDYTPSKYNIPTEDRERIYSRWKSIFEKMKYEKTIS
ncbi:MAG: sulfotransferase [Candidatus Heimdallarchaeota archaeon]|nr:sulfotransferase [Candidatus Heimdallarchaeota archaeon]